jgi:cobalamin-dependent methionine synthase I
MKKLRIIGEGMHIMNPEMFKAVNEQDEQAIIRLAKKQIKAGADALDLNLGQSRKLGRITPWLVETIQDNFDVPLFLSSHVLKQQRALEIHKGRPTINAVTATPEELTRAMETAEFFNADLVVLLVSSGLTPVDVDGRLQLAAQVLEHAEKIGLALNHLYLDPLLTIRPDPIVRELNGGLPDIDTVLESIQLIGELSDHKVKTIVGLSNSSLCLPPGRRSAFHCRLLPMLYEAGLDAVIMNCLDSGLVKIAENPLNEWQNAA